MKKKLRSGYTTGACAAAAAKAAMLVMRNALSVTGKDIKEKKSRITHHASRVTDVEIPFPDGSRVSFKIHNSKLITLNSKLVARASVIKDAGDDPDVTNGAEIVAEVRMQNTDKNKSSLGSGLWALGSVIIKGGKGVGIVTKPGLPVPVGESAINPVPRRMIKEAIKESLETHNSKLILEVTISVVDGEELAKKTLNSRLGIIGGISILGTTGIVKPISTEAWTATITSSMDVAKEMGHEEIILSAGRSSEKAHIKKYNLSEESYVLIGDYLEYSLQEAEKHGFKKIHLCAQWAKMLKIAMAIPQTHVRFGAINTKQAVEFLNTLGIEIPQNKEFNTAREIFEFINSTSYNSELQTPDSRLFIKVCNAAKKYAEEIADGIPVVACLVSYKGEVIAESE